MENKPRVSIVILAHRNVRRLQACLASLSANATGGIDYEIVVFLNAADEPLRQYAASLDGRTRTIESPVNLGFIGGCNAAAATCSGEFLVLLNDDTEVECGWLRGLVDVAEAYPDAGAVGSCVLFPDGRLQEAGSLVWRDGSTAPAGRGENPSDSRYAFVRAVDYCSGCSLLVRRGVWNQLGGLAEGYFPMYYEDVDLCFGIRRLGFRVLYSPLSRLRHAESQTVDHGYKSFLFDRNRRSFHARWSADLSWHHEARPDDAGAVARAIHRARGGPARVLVIDDRAPNRADGSGYGRMLDTVTELAESGHSITVFPADGQPAAGRDLAMLGVEVVASRSLIDLLAEPHTFFDLAIVSRPHNFQRFAADVRRLQPQCVLLYDAEALFHRRLERQLLLERGPAAASIADEGLHMRRIEQGIRAAADVVVSVSDEESRFFLETPGSSPVLFAALHNPKIRPTSAPIADRSGIGFCAGWMGGLDSPNADALRWFVQAVLPLIRERCPEVRLHVTGDCPDSLRNQCGPGVTFLGRLPDAGWLYQRIRVAVAPMRFGAGVRYKTVEAIQYGVPVVATSVGAEGLSSEAQLAMAVADEPEAFANAVIDLITSPSSWQVARTAAIDAFAARGANDGWKALTTAILGRRAALLSVRSIDPLVVSKESSCVHTSV